MCRVGFESPGGAVLRDGTSTEPLVDLWALVGLDADSGLVLATLEFNQAVPVLVYRAGRSCTRPVVGGWR